ncbi:MAG: TIGR03086 family protein [Actinobacteria bacterium]|nr:TIGR03086 family protein [Actinomycetota bacterium]
MTPDQWSAPTGNEGQSVRQLVDHVVGGNRMATVILGGGSRRDGIDAFALSAADVDVVAAFDDSHRELVAAFAEPGALERTVAHPAMDMPGTQLLGFRITEYGLHGWDLARAIGTDDTIDPVVLDALWNLLHPLAPILAATGMFGTGASGTIADDATLQDRVLDLSGRRP